MKFLAALAIATFVVISAEASTRKHPAFSKVVSIEEEQDATSAPASASPGCACGSRSAGVFAGPVKSIVDQLKTVSAGLSTLGKELASVGNTQASNMVLVTADEGTQISEMLPSYAGADADTISVYMEGIQSFVDHFKEVMSSVLQAEGITGEPVASAAGSGGWGLVTKLNQLANSISIVDALAKATGSVATALESNKAGAGAGAGPGAGAKF